MRDELRHVVGRRHVVGQQAGRIRVVRIDQPHFRRLRVHAVDEAGRPPRRDPGQRASRGVVGGNQQEMQQVVNGHLVVQPQERRRGEVDVAADDGDHLREVGVALEEHGRRHHLGDAGNRPLVLGVFFPENLLGIGVVDDGGGGAKIRNEVAARVDLVARNRRLGGLVAGDGAGPHGLRFARNRRLGGLGDLALRLAPLRQAQRSARPRRTEMKRSGTVTLGALGNPAKGRTPVSYEGEHPNSSKEFIERKHFMVPRARSAYGSCS